MPGSYVDNAMNRRLGRVGMPRGSMPHSTSGIGGSGGSGGYYVDNSMNRGLGRVGMPHGSMPHSRNGSGSSTGSLASLLSFNAPTAGSSSYNATYVGNTYADNEYNRRVGRAGLPMGSMPISKSDNGFIVNTSHSTRNTGSYSTGEDSYAGNYFNRRSQISHTANDSANTKSAEPDTKAKKTYADNVFNRQVGRVGLPVGSRVVSKSSDSSKELSNVGLERKLPVGDKVYADNEFNRKVGRVGLPIGTRVITKPQDTHKEAVGAMKIPIDKYSHFNSLRGQSAPDKSNVPYIPAENSTTNTKTYLNNAFNARHGRVGLPLGSAKLTKSSTPKVYVANSTNYALNRDGKQVGEAVFSKKSNSVRRENYVDNSLNRQLGRVGLPRGSRPVTRKCSTTKQIPKILDLMSNGNRQEECHDYRLSDNDIYGLDSRDTFCDGTGAYEVAKWQCNRMNEEQVWMESHQTFESPKTTTTVLENNTGVIIPYTTLSIGTQIGQGRFGEVFFGEWHESVVAVKKLGTQDVSKRSLQTFKSEMMMLCELDHPTVIKLIGACVQMPDICIVMEYMDMSLFDALHVRNDFDFQEVNRLDIICQICDGLYYLHSKDIAHFGLKTTNVLLNCTDCGECEIKITDFGISMMKNNVQRTTSASDQMTPLADTVRYCAPEVLRGDMLKVEEMMMADVYSLALILYEVIYEAEPYYDLSYVQILKLVGETGITPEIPAIPDIARGIKEIMQKAWGYSPIHRPTALEILHKCSSRDQLYFERASEQ